MDHYRVYLLDARGRIARGLDMTAESAEALVREVEAGHAPQHGFEVWCGARRMAVRVPPRPSAEAGARPPL